MSTVAIKERPILFSGPMVRAILDGRKTQTRRVVKPQPPSKDWLINVAHTGQDVGLWNDHGKWRMCGAVGVCREAMGNQWPKSHEWKCPYGAIGDRLWVRETWTPDHEQFYPHFPICYRADFGPEYDRENGKVFSSEQNAWFPFRWRPAIHMPRIKSRITLEITGVRVERLHAITNRDTIAEGFEAIGPEKPLPGTGVLTQAGRFEGKCSTLRQLFSDKWVEINGAGSWSANPWVWVIEFRQV